MVISNLLPEKFVLDERSSSRLNCRIIEFEPYTADPLLPILKDRVEQAFRPGTVQLEVLELFAKEIAKGIGDCRDAFERVLRARRATQEGIREVTPHYLDSIEG